VSNSIQTLEEFFGCVIVSSFGLNGFNDDSGNRNSGFGLFFNLFFNGSKTSIILGFVFTNEVFKWVFVPIENNAKNYKRLETQKII